MGMPQRASAPPRTAAAPGLAQAELRDDYRRLCLCQQKRLPVPEMPLMRPACPARRHNPERERSEGVCIRLYHPRLAAGLRPGNPARVRAM
jgi:hypothetical protein